MTKIIFSIKNLVIIIFLGIFVFGIAGIASAQEVLPNGGDSFKTAVKIEQGEYQGGTFEKYQELYYYFQVKAGQEIEVKAEFLPKGNFTVALYDEDEEKLIGYDYDRIHQYNWLVNADKSSYNYYLKIANHEWPVDSFSLKISLTDYFDAGGQTDAGDTFAKATKITTGKYTGYLATSHHGTDKVDFYRIAVKKGETLIAKVIPSSDNTILSLSLYDDEKQLISKDLAPNKGATVSNSVEITRDGDIFAKIIAEKGDENLNIYSLEIGVEGVAVVKELGAVKEDEVAVKKSGIEEKNSFAEGLLPEKKSAEKEAMVEMMAIIIGLAVLIIIIVIIILVRKKKRSNK